MSDTPPLATTKDMGIINNVVITPDPPKIGTPSTYKVIFILSKFYGLCMHMYVVILSSSRDICSMHEYPML